MLKTGFQNYINNIRLYPKTPILLDNNKPTKIRHTKQNKNNFLKIIMQNLNSNKFQIIQWNPNGLYSKIDEIKLLINKFSPIALCIQETNFNNYKLIHLNNYISYIKNRNSHFYKQYFPLGRNPHYVTIALPPKAS